MSQRNLGSLYLLAVMAGLTLVSAPTGFSAPAGTEKGSAGAVARVGAGRREDQDGWVVLHLKGSPHEIGYQYGALAAAEIDEANRVLKPFLKHDAKRDWSFFREAAQKLFWNKLDPEYREELQGMADGLQSRGYKYDAIDMLAHNSWIDLDWYYLPALEAKQKKTAAVSRAPYACSAFIATGGATRDGKIVMAHNAWIDYVLGERWNLVLDLQPTHGARILMDAWPGFIHSGDDFAVNSAGILVTETTIASFHGFDEKGLPEFMRARKAVQYARSLDDFVRIMEQGDNGGYANTWLVGDIKTNEIGKLELGLKNVIFSRSSDGAYIGSNFPESVKLIAEECDGDLNASSNSCSDRKARWIRLMKEHRGKIGAEEAKAFLADTYDEVHKKTGASLSTLMAHGETDPRPLDPDSPPYAPTGTVNAKVVTADLAKRMKFWARIGFPDGSTFVVKPYLAAHKNFAWLTPYLKDIAINPWTLVSVSRSGK